MHSICTCSHYAQQIQVSRPPIGVMGAKRESFTRKVEKKKNKKKKKKKKNKKNNADPPKQIGTTT